MCLKYKSGLLQVVMKCKSEVPAYSPPHAAATAAQSEQGLGAACRGVRRIHALTDVAGAVEVSAGGHVRHPTPFRTGEADCKY
jgi:hypothetical protein